MSEIRANSITDAAGTGAPDFPNGLEVAGTSSSSQFRTNAILDASGGNTATINTVPLRPGVLDPENRIINGAFDFWQRGTSFTASAYGADRWVNTNSGGTVTMSRQAFSLGDTLGNNNPTYFLRQTVSGQSSASDLAVIVHRIEGARSYAGQTITLLGWARRSSGSGNMAVEVFQNFGTGGSPSSEALVTPQTVTLTSSFAPFALTFSVPSIAGKTLGTNGNDYLGIDIFTSAGSNFNARTNSLGIQTIGVDLWGVHIKVGTHTTAATDLYKQPELGPELARCQRYCTAIGDGHRYQGAFTANVGGNAPNNFEICFPVTMRGTPTRGGSFSIAGSFGINSENLTRNGHQFLVNRSGFAWETTGLLQTGNFIYDAEL
jgi:hypothetical protein